MLDAELTTDVCDRATRARDPRFDGLFFIGITTTGVYCRPVCPARVTHPDRRRFFLCAAAAEHAGFRPCLRCRPELAPGRALCDAVSRLAGAAAHRIAAGALNGRTVADLARDLCVSERHLRRALEREIGVSPIELAQTHRLLLAKRLLADTELSITRVAFASGFQSLRRFNAVFRERYRMPPSALRGARRAARPLEPDYASNLLRLTLTYRPPLAWDDLLAFLQREAIPGVEVIDGERYARTVRVEGVNGVILVQDANTAGSNGTQQENGSSARNSHLDIDVSPSLVPFLMPLLARLRQLFDLDAEPAAVDTHLAQSGLAEYVRQRPGLRIPGAIDGFEIAFRGLLHAKSGDSRTSDEMLRNVVQSLGEPINSGMVSLTHVAPGPDRIAEVGESSLTALGVPKRQAKALAAIARMVTERTLRLEPGGDIAATHRALIAIPGVDDVLATNIVMRALCWPDAFPTTDRAFQRAMGAESARVLLTKAEAWRPWRGYAMHHLLLNGGPS